MAKWNVIFSVESASATLEKLGEFRAAYVTYCEDSAKNSDATKANTKNLKSEQDLLKDITTGKAEGDAKEQAAKVQALEDEAARLEAAKKAVVETYAPYKKDALSLIPDSLFEAYKSCGLNYAGKAGKEYRDAVANWLKALGFDCKADTPVRFVSLVGSRKLSSGQAVKVNSGLEAGQMRFTGIYAKTAFKELILLNLISADMAGAFIPDDTHFTYVTATMRAAEIKAAEKAEKKPAKKSAKKSK